MTSPNISEKIELILARHKREWLTVQEARGMLLKLINNEKQAQKKEMIEKINKDFNKTMHDFSKKMQEHKIHCGVQTKLLVPFMRFHTKLKKFLSGVGEE